MLGIVVEGVWSFSFFYMKFVIVELLGNFN